MYHSLIRAAFSTTTVFILMLQVVASSSTSATAADIHWVGDQTNEPNQFLGSAPWAAGTFWEAFRPAGLDNADLPQLGDVAVFDALYDPSGEPLPGAGYELSHGGTVHFGDFEYSFLSSSSSFRRFDAIDQLAVHPTPDLLVVRNGDWTFDFAPYSVFQGDFGSLDVQAQLTVADVNESNASLTVQNGHLHNGFVTHLAAGEMSVANVVVQGSDTLWTTDSYVDLGWVGTGSIRVQDGAEFNPAGVMWIGIDRDAVGSLEIFGGGKVKSPHGAVLGRDYSTSQGNVVVSGIGSLWETAGFGIGGFGRGSVRVSQRGSISVAGDIALGSGPQADGKLRISSNGTVSAVNVRVGEQGTAAMVVETQGVANIASSLYVSSKGSVDVTGGGIVNIGAGAPPNPGYVRIGPGGTLSGSGVLGKVLNDGGTVSPGASPGAMHITGDYQQLSGGILNMEIGGTTAGTEYDQLLVTGNVLLEGVVNILFLGSFTPQTGDQFELFHGANVQFAGQLNFLNPPPGFGYTASNTGGIFSIAVVPEPTTFVLATGCAFTLLRRRRA